MTNGFSWIVARLAIPALLGCVFLLTYPAGDVGAYLQILLGLIVVIWVFVQPDGWRTEAAGLLGLLAFLILLSIFALTNPPGRDDYFSALNFVLFLLMGPLIAALSKFAAPGNVIIVSRLALAGAIFAAGWAIWQVFVVGQEFASGLASNRIKSTGTIALIGFISVLGFVLENSRRRYVYLLGPVLAALVVYLGGSRGPVLVYVVLVAVTCFALVRRKLLAVSLAALTIGIVTASLLLFPDAFGRIGKLPSILVGVFRGDELGDGSATSRFRLYQNGWRAFTEAPWIGHGWGEKAVATFPHYQPGDFDRKRWHLHSDILNFAVSGGLAGLTAYALMLLAPIVGAWRSVRDSQYRARLLGTILLSAAFASYGAFNMALGFEYLTTLYVMLAAILIGYCRDAPLPGPRKDARQA